MHLKSKVFAFASASLVLQPLFAQQTRPALFESTIQPILKTSCQTCHNDKARSSGLSLATRDSAIAGGNRGVAIKPGNPAGSLLLQAVEQSADLKMPPGGKLQPDQVAAIRRWIEEGAVWTDQSAATKPRGADHWAFQPVRRTDPPAVQNTAWTRNPIDRFILARLEKEHLKPSPEADKPALLRRVSLDLTGLLPSPKEVQDFVSDSRPDAYERVVDRLLASPHYGERWGRHWLDVARYADSDGYTIDAPRQ